MLKIDEHICSICGKKYDGYGNNAQPIMMKDAVMNVTEKL